MFDDAFAFAAAVVVVIVAEDLPFVGNNVIEPLMPYILFSNDLCCYY